MDEWPISKSLWRCFGTGRDIKAGEEYFAALVQTESGFERRDFSAEYWQQNKPEVFCYWKTRLPDADQKKQIFVDEDMLMAFFERLSDQKEQEKINFRFVLALILMRKRRLKYDSSRTEDGMEIWRLKKTGADEYVDVANPHLGDEQIQQLSGQMGQILHADLSM